MIRTINSSALAYWRAHGYNRSEVDELCREIDKEIMAARIDFLPERRLCVAVSQRTAETLQGHVPAWVKFFEKLNRSWDGPPLLGSIVLLLEDGMWSSLKHASRKAPLMACGRPDHDWATLLVPDPAFLNAEGHREALSEIDEVEATLTWEQKRSTAFWRGASSGIGLGTDLWQNVPRIRLALASQKLGDPELLDAYLSKVVQFPNPEHAERIHALGIVRDPCPFRDFLQYRYQIDIEGMNCAWLSYFLKLCSRSVVLKIRGEYLQWYYDELCPWKHYIPVESDLSDLKDLIQWARAHAAECQEISRAARSAMKMVTFARELKAVGEMIYQLLQCQRDAHQYTAPAAPTEHRQAQAQQ